ncbi:helix-turn-helix transcriptional regulator [Marinimicrobium locisalis]|uniref:helix-turn-helix transcriptional regulator n=1 Tax=Marinimicrobium locisalis TaxID=546022 RepID=UPI003222050E
MIRLLYESATSEPAWESFFKELLNTLRLRSGNLLTTNIKSGEICSHYQVGEGIELHYMDAYMERYRHEDPIISSAFKQPFGTVVTFGTLCVPGDYQLVKSDYYQKWCVPQDIFDGACAQVLSDGDWCTFIVLERRKSEGAFKQTDIALIERLLPHLRQAFQIHLRFTTLKNESSGLDALLALFPYGTAAIDSNGLISNINQKAIDILNRHPGVTLNQKRLSFEDAVLSKRVSLSIINSAYSARETADYSVHIYRVEESASPLHLLVLPFSPLSRSAPTSSIKAIIALYDSKQPLTPHISTIAALYRLTQSEAELTTHLITGESLEEIARKSCKSKETLRGYLKTIFRKLNVTRQAELVAKILTGPAILGAAVSPIRKLQLQQSISPQKSNQNKKEIKEARLRH